VGTSVETLKRWFKSGVDQGATHMIVVCDTYDWSDYPVYVLPAEDVREVEAKYAEADMSKVMEVYKMAMGMSAQMSQRRAFNY